MTRNALPEDAIAVVGLGCRFPGARNADEFWRNLCGGVESIRTFSTTELADAGVDPSLAGHPRYVPRRGTVDGIERFDAEFFGLTPREAEITDPQHRLFLECAWQALESAGYAPGTFEGRAGVYAGVRINSYLLRNLLPNRELVAAAGDFPVLTGNDKDYLSTRVSYKLDLRGPSVTVQTACSTSLVAVHLACESLLSGECDLALAGGVNLEVPQAQGYVYAEEGILAPDGHCRAFDAAARGTVPGSGLGAVVLKRLDDAVDDGDRIRAVLRGWAMNNDGGAKVGYTAPGEDGQAQVIAEALTVSGVDPSSIGYVETHGTGTLMGDPIEISALTRAFRTRTDATGFCAIGSVKTNIGHLDTAAGVAGLIKTVLALEHRRLPPSLHFERPNPRIDFESTPFFVQSELTDWHASDGPRRAGLSSFGIGGTNVHLVLEEAPPRRDSEVRRAVCLLPLSARTEPAVEEAAVRLADHLASGPADGGSDGADGAVEPPLADVAYTLQAGRRAFGHRRAVLCRDRAEASSALRGEAPALRVTGPEAGAGAGSRPVAFLLPGQGSRHVGMGAGLYREEPPFREAVDRCCEILAPELGLDLDALLYPPSEGPDRADGAERAEERLSETALSQPAQFTIQYALARLWSRWGVEPAALLGHSVGELVAACLAGVFTLEDGLRLVAERGRLMQGMERGVMLTVALGAEALDELVREPLSVATVNTPDRTVVGGPEAAIAELEAALSERKVPHRRLATSHAFHSPMMEPAVAPWVAAVGRVTLEPPERPFLSNVTGTWITEAEATDPEYWGRHLRSTVRLSACFEELFRGPWRLLLELGPGDALGAIARRHPARPAELRAFPSLPRSPEAGDGDSAPETALATLAGLWTHGAEVDWEGFHAGERLHRVELPTYPFERRRYWVEAPSGDRRDRDRGELGELDDRPRGRAPLEDRFFLPSWKQAMALPVPEDPADARWLVLSSGSERDELVVRKLAAAGVRVVTAVAGEAWAETAEDRFTVRPASHEDLGRLLERLGADPPTRIVHLLELAESAPAPGDRPEGTDGALPSGFSSLLALGRALGANPPPEGLRLMVVCDGIHRVTGDEARTPEKAALLGPCRVLPHELPGIECSCLDLLPLGSDRAGVLAELILTEAGAETGAAEHEPLVAYRHGLRWLPSYEPVALPADDAGAALRDEGVYLITGGLGGVGMTLAGHLARTCRPRLVLTRRSPVPPREEWDDLAGDDTPDGRLVAGLRRLEAAGATVMAEAADVTDREAMTALLDRVRERFGDLDGVIHAAGVAGEGLIQRKEPEAAARVLAPKLRGARVLDEVLGDRRLDFLVFCSSTLGLTGGLGMVDYAAANAVLDQIAWEIASRREGLVVSVDWPGWREVGMAAAAQRRAAPATAATGADAAATVDHPLLGRRIERTERRVAYRAELSPERHWVLAEHSVQGTPVLPGTAYLELAAAALKDAAGADAVELGEVFFVAPLLVPTGTSRTVDTVLERRDGGEDGFEFRILSQAPDGPREHARGRVAAASPRAPAGEPAGPAEEEGARVVPVESGESAITWGPHWDSLEEVRVGDGATFGTLALEEELRPEAGDYLLHPALLDVATSFAGRQAAAGGFFPVSYDRVVARGPLPASIRCVAVRRDGTGEDALVFDVWIRDEDGAEVARIEGFALRRVGAERETAAVHAPGTAVEGPGSGGNGVPEGSLSPDEGIDAFRRVLAGVRAPQIIVSTEDFGRVLERVRRTAGRLGSEPADRTGSSGPAGPPGSTQSHPRPDMGTPYAAPESALEERLVRAWGAVLGIEGVGVDDNFFELGGDSLLVLQLASAARESGWSLTPNQIFENPTIRELAGLLSDGPESGPDSGPDSGPASGRGDTAVGEPEGAEPFALASPAVRARVLEGERPDRVQDAYPLSPMQQGMLFHTLFAPESGVYFEQFAYTLRGSIDLAAFHRAWQIAMDRHDILRTAFLWEDLDEPHQIVLRRLEAPLEVLDWRRLPAPIRERHLADTLRRDRQRGFDLSRPPLLRSTLVRVEEDVHYFVWRIHHILLDGWSGALLFREVFALYDRLRRGERPELPEALPYRDYIAWLERQDLEAAEDHWRRALAGFTHPTPLTVDRPADGREEHGGYDEHAEPLPVDLSSGLTELARRRGLTLNTLTLGAWALLLARYGGESEVVVGVTTSGRPVDLPRADSMIGLFINTLPARVAVPEREDVVSWLRRVQLEQAESRQYDYAPLLQIKKWSDVPVHLDLFESLQGLERFPLDPSGTAEVVPGLRLEGFQIFERTNYPLTVLAIPGDSLRIEVWFQRERFDRTTVRRLTGHLRTLFAGMVETPDGPVGSLSVLTRAERAQLAAWNDTAAATPRHRPVHELVRERAARTPDAVALTAGGCRLTYGEMLRRSGRVARRLRAAGVGAETLVAVCSRRSPDTVCALLGILESGGAYLPLDPEQPARRMAFQVDEGGAAVALVDADLIDRVPEPVRSIALPLEDAVAGASAPAGGAEQPPGDPGQLAYLLYTSGSTGRPKGVAVEHRSLVNHCAALAGTYGLAPGDRLLQFVPLTFDASVEEIFPALLAGAELVLPPEGEITAAALLRFCSERAVTILHLPTALWEQWTAADEPLPWSARILHVGGEAVSATVLRRWARRAPRPVRFLNGYGPTEATILTTCFETASDRAVREDLEPVPIGRPFANKRVHLLDAALRRVPVGVPGQLWVGGVGLARGYRNRPGLTASSFLPDPLSGEPGSRLYATGDLARYAPDGRIEFLGRLDDQVKVRGVRIEPGEVESCLQEHPGVGEVAVVPRSRGGSETRLVAYVTSRDEPDEPHPPHLSEEWVSHWRHLFEDQYGTVSPARDPRDNFLGWTSSYDGEAIPEDEMREWVETTVERIRSLEPRRILEIGCGSGLLLLRLAGDCEQYVGTDFSEKALDYLRGHVEAASPELDSVELVHRSAEDLDGVGRDFDVVVLNSVVQYFPGPSYLRRVITGAARIVRPGGWIFLGDLRSLPLLPAFRASVELHRAPDSLPVAELRDRVRSSLDREEELVVAPELFGRLRRELPEIAEARALVKRGRHHNELTGFRFDALLRIGDAAPEPVPGGPDRSSWLDWRRDEPGLERLERLLAEESREELAVHGVADARVARAVTADALCRAPAEEAPATAGAMRAVLDELPPRLDPEELWELGDRLGYHTTIRVGRPGTLDVVWRRRSPDGSPWDPLPEPPDAPDPSGAGWHELANQPLRALQDRQLEEEVRAFLSDRLPEPAVPDTVMVLDALPLTSHGKLDRDALPEPGGRRAEPGRGLVPARSATELDLLHIWEELFESAPLGVRDDFFALGGHSLLAARLMSMIKVRLGYELPLSVLFENPTVEHLASVVRRHEPVPASPLVPVQRAPRRAAGEREPLFLVHPVGGNVLCYAALARHLGDRPVYGLSARGLVAGETPSDRIEEMASRYAEAVAEARPEGPLVLGGWSMGGVVAYEMAQRLQRAGREVSLLALIDAYPAPPPIDDGGNRQVLRLFAADLVRRTPLPPEDLAELEDTLESLAADGSDADGIGRILEPARDLGLLPPDVEEEQLERLLDVFRTHLVAQEAYRPGPYTGRVVVFRTGGEDDGGWGELVERSLTVEPVPGDHYSVMAPPHVEVLAERLRRHVHSAAGASTSPRSNS